MSLDTSVLDGLFSDDWNNLYKPMHVTDVDYGCCNHGCCETGGNQSSVIDDLITRQEIVESRLEAIDVIGDAEKVANLIEKVDDVSVNLDNLNKVVEEISEENEQIKKNQEEIENFLGTVFQWENQNGTLIGG